CQRRRGTRRGYYRELAANQIGRQRGQSVILAFCPAILDRGVLPFDVASFLQPLAKRGRVRCKLVWRRAVEEPDHRRRRLLRARRERPSDRRAADERDEVAAFDLRVHSITSSARSRNASGIVRPSALAVVKLMTRSNLVGCSIGISPGFAPRRILST